MGKTDLNPKVDDYIAKSQPFARPILKHLRGLVHRGCPGVEETIKWGMPFFEYRSGILGNMSGFKAHCSFGFWGREIKAVLRKDNAVSKDGMGSLGVLPSSKSYRPTQVCLAGSVGQPGLSTAGNIPAQYPHANGRQNLLRRLRRSSLRRSARTRRPQRASKN